MAKTRAGPQRPFNTLGSTTSTPARKRAQTPIKQRKQEIKSDATLLLDPPVRKGQSNSSNRRLPSLKNDRSHWERCETTTPVTVLTRDHEKSTPSRSKIRGRESHPFSDDEMNNMELTTVKQLEVSGYRNKDQLAEYTDVTIPIEKITFLPSRATMVNRFGGDCFLRLSLSWGEAFCFMDSKKVFSLQMSQMEALFYVDLNRTPLDSVPLHFQLRNPIKGQNHTAFQIMVSPKNSTRLIHLLKDLFKKKTRGLELRLMENVEVCGLVSQKKALKKLDSKPFSSLLRPGSQKKSTPLSPGTKIVKPTSSLRSSSQQETAATPVKSFYAPVDPTPPSRVTRSSKRQLEPINIDDTPKPARKRQRRVPFKPALRYVFQDTTVFRITDADYRCLEARQWVNDTLIDFFMKYYTEEMVKLGTLDKEEFHSFSTFFFSKLTSSKEYYTNIRRWVSKLDLLNKQFIIIPINESLHWYCSIIYNPKGLLTEDEECTVFVFDSLAQKHDDIIEPFQSFLVGYAKEKYDKQVDPSRIKLKIGAVPIQPNFNDCGVHVMYNVYKFLSNRERCLEIWTAESRRGARVKLGEFFKQSERDQWRAKMRTQLQVLQKEMIERGEVDPEEDAKDVAEEEEEEDDVEEVMWIDPEEFERAMKSKEEKKDDEEEVKSVTDGVKNLDTSDAESEKESSRGSTASTDGLKTGSEEGTKPTEIEEEHGVDDSMEISSSMKPYVQVQATQEDDDEQEDEMKITITNSQLGGSPELAEVSESKYAFGVTTEISSQERLELLRAREEEEEDDDDDFILVGTEPSATQVDAQEVHELTDEDDEVDEPEDLPNMFDSKKHAAIEEIFSQTSFKGDEKHATPVVDLEGEEEEVAKKKRGSSAHESITIIDEEENPSAKGGTGGVIKSLLGLVSGGNS